MNGTNIFIDQNKQFEQIHQNRNIKIKQLNNIFYLLLNFVFNLSRKLLLFDFVTFRRTVARLCKVCWGNLREKGNFILRMNPTFILVPERRSNSLKFN